MSNRLVLVALVLLGGCVTGRPRGGPPSGTGPYCFSGPAVDAFRGGPPGWPHLSSSLSGNVAILEKLVRAPAWRCSASRAVISRGWRQVH
jgi:hypothetical protein